jgi:tRNA dimethylallyltransferase
LSTRSGRPFPEFNFARTAAIALIGPTGSGKTDLLVELSRRIPIEVINCDSMQVYKELRVLSQAPSAAVTRRVRHHGVGVLPVSREYSAARFVEHARKLVPLILKRGRLPVIAGGTGLYLNSLVDGLFDGPEAQPEVRARLYARAEKEGAPVLHAELMRADAAAAAKIHPNDTRRIVRALEVIETSGETFSALKARRKGVSGEWAVGIWGLEWDRAELYARIDRRVPVMVRSGARAEAGRLARKKLSRTAAACLGLEEMQAWNCGWMTREQAVAQVQMNTRRYAKRQLTWFRRDERIRWIRRTPDQSVPAAADQLASEVRRWLTEEAALKGPSAKE